MIQSTLNRRDGLNPTIQKDLTRILNHLNELSEDERIKQENQIKLFLHEYSSFKNEPVDCVIWVKNEIVKANDYNPNTVAPPEMELLKISINADGYTQPIVSFKEESEIIVVDGFHISRVGKEDEEIKKRVKGYLPITLIRESQEGKDNRIAATVRHNRARGKHRVEGMSDIVLELKRRNWSDAKISKNLGMDPDEVLRLYQITGLRDIFKDDEFSKSWDVDILEDIDEEIL